MSGTATPSSADEATAQTSNAPAADQTPEASGDDTRAAAPPIASGDALARQLRGAIDAQDAELVTFTFGQLARGMSTQRGAWGDAMHATLRAFAQVDQRALWARMQSPTIIPVLEALLDLQDWAALDRLTRAFAHGAAAEQVAAYAALVVPRHEQHGRITLSGCEDGTIDGAPATDAPRLPGSWLVACGEHPPAVVLLRPNGTTRVIAEEGLIALVDVQNAPPSTP